MIFFHFSLHIKLIFIFEYRFFLVFYCSLNQIFMVTSLFSLFFSYIPSNSEHLSSLTTLASTVSESSFPSPSLGLPSATPSPSLGLPSAATPPSSTASAAAASRVETSGGSGPPRSLPPHLGFSQNKDVPSAAALTVMHVVTFWMLFTFFF